MYCHICGKELPDQAETCPECGMCVPETRENRTRKVAEPIEAATVKPLIPKIEPRKPSPSDYPMKWYYFMIYAGLIINAIGLFISGLVYLINWSSISWMGVLCIFNGVYALIVRSSLANFNSNAPKQLLSLYICSYGTGIIANIIQYAQLSDWIAESPVGTSYIVSIIISLVIGLIVTICNYTYFENRQALFTN